LHVPGIKKGDIFGERSERIFVEFSYSRARQGKHATGQLRVMNGSGGATGILPLSGK
jgi:hypothetical protein